MSEPAGIWGAVGSHLVNQEGLGPFGDFTCFWLMYLSHWFGDVKDIRPGGQVASSLEKVRVKSENSRSQGKCVLACVL